LIVQAGAALSKERARALRAILSDLVVLDKKGAQKKDSNNRQNNNN